MRADTINLFSKLTYKKVVNGLKLLLGFHWSRLTGMTINKALPVSISIEPTTACNLGCPECPSGLKQFSRNTGNLKFDTFTNILDQLSDELLYLTFYFQGEPFIHPGFLDMVNYAHKKGIYTATSTNAHFLDDQTAKKTIESGLDRLIISIDGTTQKVYESYRKKGELSKVLKGAKNILQWKRELSSKTPHVIFQFLVVRPNEHQIEEVQKMGKEMGVDEVRFKTAQIYDYKNGNPLIPTIDKYSRYKKQANGTYKIKNTLDNHCWKMWHSCVITWDGLVVPCCFDKDAKHQFGNLQERSFREIWNNPKYLQFRKSLLKSRKEIDICKNCSEGTRTSYKFEG